MLGCTPCNRGFPIFFMGETFAVYIKGEGCQTNFVFRLCLVFSDQMAKTGSRHMSGFLNDTLFFGI